MSNVTDLVRIKPAWPVPAPDTSFVPIGPWNTNGLIVFTPLQNEAHSRYLQDLRQQGFPILFIGTGEDAPTVAVRNETGIYQAVKHMAIFHGHHHIGFIAGHPDDGGDSDARLRAFRSAAADYGLDSDPRLIVAGMHDVPGGYQAALQILRSGVKCTALIASNDASATGAMQAIRATTTLQIPHDIAIVGFDDQPDAIAQVPPLASVHLPLLEIGQQALTLMSDYLNGIQELETIELPTRLVSRQSCGCLPEFVHSVSADKARSALSEKQAEADTDVNEIQRRVANGMIAALPHFLRYPFGEWTSRLCNSLVEGFYTSLKTEDAIPFQKKLMDFLQELELRDENVDAWQNIISALRRDMTGLPAAWQQPQTKNLAEDLLHQARCAISESVQRQVHRHRYHQQIAEQTLSEITSRLNAILDEQQAVEILEENLGSLGIRHARVALFEAEGENPFAWSVILNSRVEPASRRFPTHSFPPPGLYPAEEVLNVIILPLSFQSETFGYIAFDTGNLGPCAAVARQLASAFKTSRLHKQVIELSLKDPLTGIYNRRHFDTFLNEETKRSLRLGNPLTIIMLDIDHFKKYNDTFGHPAGDKVLQNLAVCIREGRRSTDVAARIGGEEFALILPGTDLAGARIVAERILQLVRTSPNFEHSITVSMGIGALPRTDASAETLIKEADMALYEAKQTGRDRVCVFDRSKNNTK